MGEDPKYPIYFIAVKWVMDGKQDPECPGWWKGLPEGRVYNGTSFRRMFKEDPGKAFVLVDAEKWWVEYEKRGEHPSNPEFAITREEETWMLTWFCHQTFDVGQTNDEALCSFEDFLRRKGICLRYSNDPYDHPEPSDGYCAMGAEDRWRWSAAYDDDGNPTDPPCRCEGCKKAGVIRINH